MTISKAAYNVQQLDLPGCVRMTRTADGEWVVFNYDGTLVDISTSTTDGLQEAINAACSNGYDLVVDGGGHKTSGGSVGATITCTTGIDWPPMQGNSILLKGCDIQFTGAVGGSPGFDFDSCMGVHFALHGEIIYAGTGVAVLFKPVNGTPLDAEVTCVDSRFMLGTPGSSAPNAVIQWDVSNGAIQGNFFEFVEIIDGQAGLHITNPTHGFQFNFIRCPHIHNGKTSNPGCVMLGTSAASASNISGNIVDVCVYVPNLSIGLTCYGSNNLIRCALVNDGTTSTGIQLPSSASGNQFQVALNTCTSPVDDSSTTKDNVGMYAGAPPAAMATLAADQTLSTATWTKLSLATEVYDVGAKFDNATNYRWTPGRTGIVKIYAKVGFLTVVDATDGYVGIYKNGSQAATQKVRFNGTGTEQGASVYYEDRCDADDYFEVYARQDTGGNADVSSIDRLTSASFNIDS